MTTRGYTYILESERFFKVGFSRNLRSRMYRHRRETTRFGKWKCLGYMSNTVLGDHKLRRRMGSPARIRGCGSTHDWFQKTTKASVIIGKLKLTSLNGGFPAPTHESGSSIPAISVSRWPKSLIRKVRRRAIRDGISIERLVREALEWRVAQKSNVDKQ